MIDIILHSNGISHFTHTAPLDLLPLLHTHFVDVVIIAYYYLDCLSLILPTSTCFT